MANHGKDSGVQVRKDLMIFNRYVAQAAGGFKAPSVPGRKVSGKGRIERIEAKFDALDARRHELTAAQYMRQLMRLKGRLNAAKKPADKPQDLREQFLKAAPRVMRREGWGVKDLEAAGVPYADLVALGLRKPRGPKKKAVNDDRKVGRRRAA